MLQTRTKLLKKKLLMAMKAKSSLELEYSLQQAEHQVLRAREAKIRDSICAWQPPIPRPEKSLEARKQAENKKAAASTQLRVLEAKTAALTKTTRKLQQQVEQQLRAKLIGKRCGFLFRGLEGGAMRGGLY